jgi:putative membrane protein
MFTDLPFATSLPRNAARRLAAAAIYVSVVVSCPAWSQAAVGPNRGDTPSATSGSSSGFTREDREMISDLVEANIAEIETGKLALQKTKNPEVKRFAQQMIDDHSKALQEVQQLGQTKNVELPKDTDFGHKSMATALKMLTGATFDKRYVSHVGVGDHRRTLDLLQKIQREAKDPDLKAFAVKTAPVVEHHLAMARQMAEQMK